MESSKSSAQDTGLAQDLKKHNIRVVVPDSQNLRGIFQKQKRSTKQDGGNGDPVSKRVHFASTIERFCYVRDSSEEPEPEEKHHEDTSGDSDEGDDSFSSLGSLYLASPNLVKQHDVGLDNSHRSDSFDSDIPDIPDSPDSFSIAGSDVSDGCRLLLREIKSNYRQTLARDDGRPPYTIEEASNRDTYSDMLRIWTRDKKLYGGRAFKLRKEAWRVFRVEQAMTRKRFEGAAGFLKFYGFTPPPDLELDGGPAKEDTLDRWIEFLAQSHEYYDQYFRHLRKEKARQRWAKINRENKPSSPAPNNDSRLQDERPLRRSARIAGLQAAGASVSTPALSGKGLAAAPAPTRRQAQPKRQKRKRQ